MLFVEKMDMATQIQIDDRLIEKAVETGGHRTKREAVTRTLIEYIQHREQEKIVSLFGTIHIDPRHNYKKQRARP